MRGGGGCTRHGVNFMGGTFVLLGGLLTMYLINERRLMLKKQSLYSHDGDITDSGVVPLKSG